MRKLITTFLFFSVLILKAQSPLGAWQANTQDATLEEVTVISIVSEGYQAITWYNTSSGAFIRTLGGAWSLNGSEWSLNVEFDSERPEQIGETLHFAIAQNTKGYSVSGMNLEFRQIDTNTPGALAGAWLMSARKRGETLEPRSTDQPRKTMKILSGTRFQWIAYNTETKQFMGTGGGHYTTENGTYTEHIEFFSRDNSRVGAALAFKFERIDNDWHHSGLSSRGDPIYEVWSLRK
ncbi:MAG: membrane or secreted protein [Flavobacteriaceae bacterium]